MLTAIADGDLQSGHGRVGAQEVEAIEFGLGGGLVGIDGEAAAAFGLDEAAEAVILR